MVYLLLVGLGSIVGIALFWRLSSARYSLPCPIWLSWFIEIDNPFAEENRAAKIIERLAVKEGMTIADIGCGTGRLTIPLIKSVGFQGFVVAVDMQKVMLEKVKRKLPDAQNLECIHANVGDGKLGKYKYDRIVMVNMLGEIPHQEVALQEVVQLKQ